jgi:hypothetical protein
LSRKDAIGLQKKLSGRFEVLLGAEKEGKIEVTIKFQ